jgi:hypothetical protein
MLTKKRQSAFTPKFGSSFKLFILKEPKKNLTFRFRHDSIDHLRSMITVTTWTLTKLLIKYINQLYFQEKN